jgi:hypothetical protein
MIFPCEGNVSPIPQSGSPPVPDKFTLRSSQTLNLAKKGDSGLFELTLRIRIVHYGTVLCILEEQL